MTDNEVYFTIGTDSGSIKPLLIVHQKNIIMTPLIMSKGKSGRHSTAYIRIDTGLCQACWECVDTCPEGVIGKLKVLFHKHAKIVNGERCQGCLICVETCQKMAISPVNP